MHESVAGVLNIMEAVAIAVSEPRLNLQRGRWGEATQYYQVEARRDDNQEEEDT